MIDYRGLVKDAGRSSIQIDGPGRDLSCSLLMENDAEITVDMQKDSYVHLFW